MTKEFFLTFLPPANEVCEGYVFTPVCQSFCSQEGLHPSMQWVRQPPPQGRHHTCNSMPLVRRGLTICVVKCL